VTLHKGYTFAIAVLLLASQRAGGEPKAEEGIDWSGLLRQSFYFSSLQHGFRLGTEPGTRGGMKGSFVRGWGESVKSLHGWADGDPFYVNYVGHPMQGAISGYIWIYNDGAYRRAEFSRDAYYWRSRLRAAGFAALYSEQFEIGPYSEASIGKIQRDYPQRGFVDHVVTPTIGLGWMIAEDVVDRYVIKRIERDVEAPWVRVLLRGGLNPARSLANMMAGRPPWYRSTRPGTLVPRAGYGYEDQPPVIPEPPDPPPGVAPFEVGVTAQPEWYLATNRSCIGGSVSPALRLSARWQLVADIGGCNLLGLPELQSGDVLQYRVGPRWNSRPTRALNPHAQFLVGGIKISRDRTDPRRKQQLEQLSRENGSPMPRQDVFMEFDAEHRFSISAGAGVDYALNRAFALRLVSFEYRHAWLPPVGGADYSGGVRLSSGLVLRIGTW
jgi:hypothetical protein